MDKHHTHGLPYHYGYEADYLEDPDYIANDTRHQLPLLSNIGRGPRGAGIKIKVNKGADGSYKLDFVNDLTNETLATTPNLDPGYFTITSTTHPSVDGESRIMHVFWIHGAERKSWDIPIPAGAHGSRLYLSAKEFTWKSDLTYQTTVDDLIHYGKNNWPSKPAPRPNDIVCFVYKGGKEYRTLAFGTIEAVEKGQVVFTSRTSINIPIPSIGKNGHWYVDGVDTGVTAQGPKGDKGDTGPRGLTGAQGPKGATGKAGAQGPKGDDGKDAQIEIGTVTTLAPTMPASVSAERDPKTNVTTLNFGIPEGAAGKAINIRGGIWEYEFLPPFDDTPINDAFIVYDGDKQFDLYVRGQYPVQAELGGPWTVVENWQGRPGSSVRYMLAPKILFTEIGEELEISTAEAESVFAYYDYLADDDLVIDSRGTVGIISSAEDNSGTYVITTVGTISIPWNNVTDKPFDSIGDNLTIENGVLDVPLVSTENAGIVPKIDTETTSKFYPSIPIWMGNDRVIWATWNQFIRGGIENAGFIISDTEGRGIYDNDYLYVDSTSKEDRSTSNTPLFRMSAKSLTYGSANNYKRGFVPANTDTSNRANQALFGDGVWKDAVTKDSFEDDLESSEAYIWLKDQILNNTGIGYFEGGDWKDLKDGIYFCTSIETNYEDNETQSIVYNGNKIEYWPFYVGSLITVTSMIEGDLLLARQVYVEQYVTDYSDPSQTTIPIVTIGTCDGTLEETTWMANSKFPNTCCCEDENLFHNPYDNLDEVAYTDMYGAHKYWDPTIDTHGNATGNWAIIDVSDEDIPDSRVKQYFRYNSLRAGGILHYIYDKFNKPSVSGNYYTASFYCRLNASNQDLRGSVQPQFNGYNTSNNMDIEEPNKWIFKKMTKKLERDQQFSFYLDCSEGSSIDICAMCLTEASEADLLKANLENNYYTKEQTDQKITEAISNISISTIPASTIDKIYKEVFKKS